MSQENAPDRGAAAERRTENQNQAANSSNESTRASEKMLSEVNQTFSRNPEPITNFDGRNCRSGPQEGQLPTLRAGERTNGCNFEMPDFNTRQLYERAQNQAVRINISEGAVGGHGTGVAIGRTADTCYVATANHVAGERHNQNITSREVRFGDGSAFPANIEMRLPSKDLSILSVRTGADTDRLCQPAKIAEQRPTSGEATSFGFPNQSNAFHVSPGTINRNGTYQALTGEPYTAAMRGENPNRSFIGTRAQIHSGYSGGPTYNNRGEVIAINTGVHPDERRMRSQTLLTPITQNEVNGYLRRITENSRRP
jgi:S1-C subfamily serine protease